MAKQSVECSQCGESLLRHPINPNTKLPIKNFFCNKNCKGWWQRGQREALGFDRAWLHDQYIIQGKGANQIGREIGRDGKRVWEWIIDYGIETRGRGQDANQHFKPGHKLGVGRKYSAAEKAKMKERAIQDGRVPYLKNGQHWLKSGNKDQHPNWKGGMTPERQSLYSSKEWVDAVKAVWERDSATCQRCGKHHNTAKSRGTFHVHHIVSFMVRELRAEPSNLVLLCRPCHLWVHSRKNINKDFIGATEK